MASYLQKITLCVISLIALPHCTSIPDPQLICSGCTPLNFNKPIKYPLNGFANNILTSTTTPKRLHIYLEGDGKDWWNGRIPPKNPTTTMYTSLKLMNLDTAPAAYINRPCYGYPKMPRQCDKTLWTNARYSKVVVNSIDHAIDELKSRYGIQTFVLIGHSGGGTLAMLIANKRNDIDGVITLAANLDHKLWTQLMHYSPLEKSEDATEVLLGKDIIRWHMAGKEDKRVPLEVIKSGIKKDAYAKITIHPNMDHNCCWSKIWPKTLVELNQILKYKKLNRINF